MKKVIILGAGVAGISTAVNLADKNISLKVFEASSKPGGRAMSLVDKKSGDIIDNGQHILIGAYKEFLKICQELGAMKYLKKMPMKVKFIFPDKSRVVLNPEILPGKLGMLAGLLNMNISWKSKKNALKFLIKLNISKDDYLGISSYDFLKKFKQTDELINILWEPLVVATLNASLRESDASLLAAVIRQGLLPGPKASRIYFPYYGFNKIYDLFNKYLKKHKAEIHFKSSVKELVIENGKAKGVILSNGETHYADYIISAMPAKRLKAVLGENLLPELRYINNYEYTPIVSLYLWYDREIMEEEFVALLETQAQWIFKYKNPDNKHQNIYSIVISNAENLLDFSSEEILNICLEEIERVLPIAKEAKLESWRLFRDKKATISPAPAIQFIRPHTKCSIENLYLAGDWTQTYLPATIEGAARSGKAAADEIMKLL